MAYKVYSKDKKRSVKKYIYLPCPRCGHKFRVKIPIKKERRNKNERKRSNKRGLR